MRTLFSVASLLGAALCAQALLGTFGADGLADPGGPRLLFGAGTLACLGLLVGSLESSRHADRRAPGPERD